MVSLEDRTVTVTGETDLSAVKQAIRDAGYEIIESQEDTIMQTVIKVNGMMCTHCKARVEGICKEAPGVTDAVVDLAAKTVTVSGNTDIEALKKAINDAGYEVVG